MMPMKDTNESIGDVHSKSLINEQAVSSVEFEREEQIEVPDSFSKEIEEWVKHIDEVDLRQTVELVKESKFHNDMVKFRSEPDERRGRPAVPKLLQDNLADLVPGWLAQESRFRKDAVSSSKATGYAQIKPNVWEEYKKTSEVSLDIGEQMEVFGELVSDNYHYILHFAGEDVIETLRSKFDSEDKFIEALMTPLMVNAYNAGGPMIGRALNKFVESVPVEEMKSGRDLFVQFTDFAKDNVDGFKEEQDEYVPKVYAFNDKLDNFNRG
jgi:hypothetical protein